MPRPVHWPNPIILPDGLDDTGAPDALVCPITQELMREPCLVTTSGRTYERDAINRWIREHGTDPLQRSNSLRLEDLAPNLAVRQMVEEFARERNGGSLPSRIPREPAPAPAPASPNPPNKNSWSLCRARRASVTLGALQRKTCGTRMHNSFGKLELFVGEAIRRHQLINVMFK